VARGLTLKLTRDEVVQRALLHLVAMPKAPNGAPHPIGYRLDDQNGGKDPGACHCAYDSYSYGDRVCTADCIGLALHCSGIDRKQPGYKGLNGEWLNCKSLLADARGAQRFCRTLKSDEVPLPGDWLLTDTHIGVIVRGEWTDISDPNKPKKMPVMVVDCSPRHDKTRAAAIGLGYAWSPKCEVIRPLFYRT